MPGLVRKVPRWLLDETGPLYLDWREVPRLVPWLIAFLRAGREDRVRAISAALAALNGPTLDLLMPLLQEAGLDALVQRRGMLYVDPIGQESVPATASPSRCSGRRATGSRCSMPAAFATLSLRSRRGSRKGVFVPAAAHTLDPHRLVTGLAEHFERQGGSFRRARVDRILAAESDHAATEAGGEIHDHDVVVVAAGVWSKPLVTGLGYSVPLVAQRGYHVTFTEPWRRAGQGRPAARPRCDHRAHGDGDQDRRHRRVRGRRCTPEQQARRGALSSCQSHDSRARHVGEHTTWMGERPCTPDSLPVLCRAPRHPAVLFAFGHGHQGLIGAAKTAEVIADLVAERPPRLDLAPFDVKRFRRLPRLR